MQAFWSLESLTTHELMQCSVVTYRLPRQSEAKLAASRAGLDGSPPRSTALYLQYCRAREVGVGGGRQGRGRGEEVFRRRIETCQRAGGARAEAEAPEDGCSPADASIHHKRTIGPV